MTFTRPVAGPKVYISRGPSGHPETFRREEADQSLRQLLGSISPTIAVEGFVRKMTMERRLEGWADVLTYLGGLIHLEPDAVPLNAAVAFWAQVSLAQEASRRTVKEGN